MLVNVILLDQLQWSTIGVVVCSFQRRLLFRCSVLLFQSCGCSSPATSLPSILCCFHVTTLTQHCSQWVCDWSVSLPITPVVLLSVLPTLLSSHSVYNTTGIWHLIYFVSVLCIS